MTFWTHLRLRLFLVKINKQIFERWWYEWNYKKLRLPILISILRIIDRREDLVFHFICNIDYHQLCIFVNDCYSNRNLTNWNEIFNHDRKCIMYNVLSIIILIIIIIIKVVLYLTTFCSTLCVCVCLISYYFQCWSLPKIQEAHTHTQQINKQ